MRALIAALVLVAACSGSQSPSAALPQPTSTLTVAPPSPGVSPTASAPLPSAIAQPGEIAELRSATARLPLDAAAAADLEAMVDADTAFAIRLYHELAKTEEGDLFFSPYSISTALSMVLPGSRDQTAAELAAVLGVGSDEDVWHAARNRLDLQLAATAALEHPGEGDFTPMTLEPTNAMFGQADYPFKTPYLDTLAANYGAGLRTVDFITAPEPARLAINDWVAEQTKDRIEELLAEGKITDMTRFVLVNAIYFKANWARMFSAEGTYPEPFNLLDGTTVETPMMHSIATNQYASGAGWQAVRLGYQGDASMLVIVPEMGEFAEIEANLDPDFLADLNANLDRYVVTLSLPKWESEGEFELIPTMQALGVSDLFDSGRANLTGIADVEQMFISHVAHKANITVDEEGTEAAAATAVVGEATSAPPPATLRVDRPFIYLIQNDSTGEILFLGRLLEP